MSEMVLNGTCMYDEVEEVSNLNKVKGFDPRKYMRLIAKEGQPGRYYLDVAYRKLWFRLCFPEGKIVKKLIKLTDNVAIVEARVYLNRNDAEDNFISNALAQKYQSSDEQFGNKYVELAETAAVGRALSDAGFGLQFADKEEDFDPEVTEAPIDGQIMNGGSMLPEGTYMEEELCSAGSYGQDEVPFDNDTLPGQYGIDEYIPTPEQVGAAILQMAAPPAQQMQAAPVQNTAPQPQMPAASPARSQTPAMQAPTASQRTQAPAAAQKKAAPANGLNGISKDMPVDKIMKRLTRETAAAVVVSVGFNKGKTMGQVAVEKPENLEWYVKSYGGPDNLLRAAAKYLMEMAFAQAG